MMKIFADELIHTVAHPTTNTPALADGEIIVDVGVTKEARFVDKMAALEKYGDYGFDDGEGKRRPAEQVHLTGFDTLVRLLDVKYYPPEHSLRPLEGLFERHRVRVTRRVDDAWWVISFLSVTSGLLCELCLTELISEIATEILESPWKC